MKKKVIPFWSFIFPETYKYIIYHVYSLLLYGGKSTQQLSYGFNILKVLEGCLNEIQIPNRDMDFSKTFQK